MALDFFGVSLSGRIRQYPRQGRGQGRVVELWIDTVGDDVDWKGQRSELTDLNFAMSFVSQIDVTMKMGEISQIALVLTPTFEEGLAILDSDIIFLASGRLEVEMRYTTGTQDGRGLANRVFPFSGFLQKPDIQVGSDITITLNALGNGYPLTVAGGTDTESFGPDKSVANVVEDILKKYVIEDGNAKSMDLSNLYSRLRPAITQDLKAADASLTGAIDKTDPKTGDPFFRVPPIVQGQTLTREGAKTKPDAPEGQVSLLRGPRNDWWLVKSVLDDYGYELIFEGDKAYVVDKAEYLADAFTRDPTKRKKFLLRGNVDPERRMYPVLNFSSSTTGAWVQPGLGRTVAQDVDEKKKEPVRQTAEPSNTDAGAKSKSLITFDPDNTDWGFLQDAAKNIPGPVNPLDDGFRAKLRSEWKQSLMDSGIQCQVESIGVPDLKPGDVVDISGFGRRNRKKDEKVLFNGPYGVLEVTHSVGVGGWSTSFVGVMNLWPEELGQATKAIAKKSEAEEVSAEGEIPSDEDLLSAFPDNKKKRSRGKNKFDRFVEK